MKTKINLLTAFAVIAGVCYAQVHLEDYDFKLLGAKDGFWIRETHLQMLIIG